MKEFFKENQKMIIKGVIAVVIVYLIYKNWYRISRVLKPASVNNAPEPLTTIRKGTIEGIASDIYTDIYSTGWFGHDYAPYDKALTLYDDELKYLADYYKNFLASGNKLYDDINSQWYTTGDSPNYLNNKLAKVGKN